MDLLAACFAFASAALDFCRELMTINNTSTNSRILPADTARKCSLTKSVTVTFFNVFSYMDKAPVSIEDGMVCRVLFRMPISTVSS